MIIIVTAEAVQLFISIYHLTFPNETDACATIQIQDSPALESLITVLYRFIGYAMPVFVILWLIWVRKDPNRSFSQVSVLKRFYSNQHSLSHMLMMKKMQVMQGLHQHQVYHFTVVLLRNTQCQNHF